MGTLTGRTALVTGASRGIGRAVARRLASDGAFVAVHYGSNEGAAKQTVAAIEDTGGAAVAVQAELGAPGDADRLYAAWESALARRGVPAELDILVNNAAVAVAKPIEAVTEAEFDRLFAVNVRAPFFVVRQGLGRLRDGGRIINLSSGVTRHAAPEIIAYSMTKGALDVFTMTLAKQLGARGITVNAVAPGVIDTDMNASWLRDDPKAQQRVARAAALGRHGQPEDVADVVAFLASPDARWITGQYLDATGGSGL